MTLVHGEQDLVLLRPLRLGETLTLTGRVGDVSGSPDPAGRSTFVILETEAKDADGKRGFFSRNTIISKRT